MIASSGSSAGDTLAALRSGRLAGARELRLGHLGLTEMPDEVFGLAETLEILDLGHNALTRLPDDLGRLKRLAVLFASANRFDLLPPVLGDCLALGQVGFRGCGLREIPAEALPAKLRWLTVTENRLTAVPRALAERPALQKLMLAGNRLRELPEALRDAPNLELIRFSANRFEALPRWLAEMPRLAWAAWSGNPLDAALDQPPRRAIPWVELTLGALLGQGASGRVHAATWHRPGAGPQALAVKLFKGSMTSDGLPDREMAACLAAGAHPNVAGGIGRIIDHPEGVDALAMPVLPPHWRILANPPSLASCSRDVYAEELRLPLAVALRIAGGVARAGAHLHNCGLLHGDLYAHNVLWDGAAGDAVLSDFGAASFMPPGAARRLERLDVLAFGLLLGELLARCEPAGAPVCALQRACVAPDPTARPHLAEVVDALATEILDQPPPRSHLGMATATGLLVGIASAQHADAGAPASAAFSKPQADRAILAAASFRRGGALTVDALSIKGLAKSFDRPAVRELDLTLRAGEFYALLGPNGAGKTTTLRMIAGLLRPDAGAIAVFGIDALRRPLEAKRITAWLPDEPMLYDKLTPVEYLEFVAGLWSVEPATARRDAEALIALLGLAPHAHERCGGFSKGMRQKVALAGALVHDPRLIILDEPLTGLDAGAARQVKAVLRARVVAGCTVVMTTHILEVAERMAERIGIIAGGRLVAEGTLDELRARSGAIAADASLEDVFLDLVETAPDARAVA